MITSIVGRLIKKPELIERIHIPGKRVVAFTIVQNSQRGEKRLSVFFNLSMVAATEAQFEMVMRLEKGTVLLFSSPRITYVRQVERDEHEQVINLYAEIDNFRIVAGAPGTTVDAPALPHPADAPDVEEAEAPPQPQAPRRQVPPPARPASLQSTAAAPGRTRAHPSAPATPAPEDNFDGYGDDQGSFPDPAELPDPFAEETPAAPPPQPRPASPPAQAAPPPASAAAKRTPAPQSPPRPRRQEAAAQESPEEDEDPFA